MTDEKEAWKDAFECMKDLRSSGILGFFMRPKIHVQNWYKVKKR